jgi:hypothetical protein
MTWGPPVFKQSGNIMGRGRGRRLNWQWKGSNLAGWNPMPVVC